MPSPPSGPPTAPVIYRVSFDLAIVSNADMSATGTGSGDLRRLAVSTDDERAIVTALIDALAYVATIDASQVALSFPSGNTTDVEVVMSFTSYEEASAVAWALRSTTFDANIEQQLRAQVTLSGLPRISTTLLVPPSSPPR